MAKASFNATLNTMNITTVTNGTMIITNHWEEWPQKQVVTVSNI